MQILLTGLKALRKSAGLSQQELAEQSGLSVSTVTKHEQGAINGIDGNTLDALASALGCARHELFLLSNSDVSELIDSELADTALATA